VVEDDLKGKNARFITPKVVAELMAAADKIVTI